MIEIDSTAIWRECLLKGNLVLPLIATIIRGVINILNPFTKYVALQNAAVNIEAEIYLYRCKVGKYSNFQLNKISSDKKKDGGGKEKKKPADGGKTKSRSPRTIFSSALERIWNKLASSDLSNGSLEVPPTSMNPLADTNKRIMSNRAEQEIHYQEDTTSDAQRAKNMSFCAKVFNRIYAVFCCCLPQRKKKIAPSMLRDVGISDLAVEDYLYLRLYPVVAEMSKQTPPLARSTHSITIIAVLLSVSASGLSTFGYSVFIPLVLALVGSMSSWASYQQTEYRLQMTNAALAQLHQVRICMRKDTLLNPVNLSSSSRGCTGITLLCVL
jgi:hypothetical protein